LLPKSIVTSDWLGHFAAVPAAGRSIQMPRVVDALKPRALPALKGINTALGNLKTMISGAFKALKYRKCCQTSLVGFAYGLKHRFNTREMITKSSSRRRGPRQREKVISSRHTKPGF
jgi:hypothetical protein